MAQYWLMRSGAANRLLNAVGHEAAILDLKHALDTDHAPEASSLLYLLEQLMRHTHRAALKAVSAGTT